MLVSTARTTRQYFLGDPGVHLLDRLRRPGIEWLEHSEHVLRPRRRERLRGAQGTRPGRPGSGARCRRSSRSVRAPPWAGLPGPWSRAAGFGGLVAVRHRSDRPPGKTGVGYTGVVAPATSRSAHPHPRQRPPRAQDRQTRDHGRAQVRAISARRRGQPACRSRRLRQFPRARPSTRRAGRRAAIRHPQRHAPGSRPPHCHLPSPRCSTWRPRR